MQKKFYYSLSNIKFWFKFSIPSSSSKFSSAAAVSSYGALALSEVLASNQSRQASSRPFWQSQPVAIKW
jgi:hypothetical protein